MSNDLEVIVSPSQALDYAPAKPYYNPGLIGIPNTILRIGRGGSGKILNGSYSYSATFYMKQYINEKKKAG